MPADPLQPARLPRLLGVAGIVTANRAGTRGNTTTEDTDVDKAGMVVVTGGGGFIGAHMVRSFQEQGFAHIRAVDVKPLDEWYQITDDLPQYDELPLPLARR